MEAVLQGGGKIDTMVRGMVTVVVGVPLVYE